MFQYCLGRILAEELDFALQADALPGFPNTGQKMKGLSIEDPNSFSPGKRSIGMKSGLTDPIGGSSFMAGFNATNITGRGAGRYDNG